MKAFIKHKPEPGGVLYTEVDQPETGDEDVLIRVKAAGLCGTDMHLYHWSDNIVKEYKPELPRTMGHEFAGTIAAVGGNVNGFSIGDRVTAFPILYCGTCSYCQNGQHNICDNRPILGLGVQGAFAEYIAIRSQNVYKLDDRTPFDIGSLSEVTSVGLHALERTRLVAGESVVVVGCGPLGMIMAIMAKHAGAGKVFITGLEQDRERLELAARTGAIPISVDASDVQALVKAETNGRGVHAVFETAGTPPGVTQALDLVRKGGRICVLGQGHGTTAIPTAELSFREIDLIGTRAYSARDWERVPTVLVNLAEDLNHMITHRLPLEEADKGIDLMLERKGLKIILEP